MALITGRGVRGPVRPIWFDQGTEVATVVKRLEDAAENVIVDVRPAAQVPSGATLGVLHQAALARVRKQLSVSHGEADRTLAQEVRAIDDLVRAANLLVERLREWYALHAPEAVRLQPDAEKLTRVIAEHGDRAAVLAALDHADQAATSIGNDLDEADLAVLRAYAVALRSLYDSWHALERRVEQLMGEVAPNLAAIVGPVIGARLIALSGGLERLGSFPSGTVQLLGAETALFRHIKEGTKPPKHGILFQHVAIHSAPPWQRGALSRAYAQAASLAARTDAFSQRDLRQDLVGRLEKDVARIKQQRAKPPARRAPGRGGPPGQAQPFRGRGPRGDSRGPGGPRQGGPKHGGPRPGGPKHGGPRDGARGPPRGAGPPPSRSPARAADSGGPRGGEAPRGSPGKSFYSTGPGGQPGRHVGKSGGKPAHKSGGKPRRLPGALRGDNKPAKPPGKGDKGGAS